MLLFNTTVVYADISGTLPTPLPTIPPLPPDPAEFLIRLCLPDGGAAIDYISDWLKKRWSTDEDKSKDMSSDGNTVTFNSNFVNEFNTALQDKVHALDGYYLIEPNYDGTLVGYYEKNYNYTVHQGDNLSILSSYASNYPTFVIAGAVYPVPANYVTYIDSYNNIRWYDLTQNTYVDTMPTLFTNLSPYETVDTCIGSNYSSGVYQDKYWIFGTPFKLFYSKQDLENYVNKGRTYIPKLPSGGFKVNIKYINNTTNLPDITYNITTENKTETEIQNQYDTTINNYINNLNDFSDGGGGTTNPTPTPDGGFTDGTTPTPTPPITDGGDDSGSGKIDLKEIIDLLKQILEKLTFFTDSHTKFEKTITDYIEANDGKLDQIIEAINALSDGKTEDEKNGCKYDFTALSDFMTKLWNESDKKFDKMVELLEENNKYQKKLVNSLNEIKAILVTQTIMDVFQDRSQQTAEKAKDKFPTSLPWDIALVVNAMSAEPEKPQFNLPIQIKSLNINEEIHVDLASGEWQKLAKTCRYLLSILFILLMIQLSRKLFSNGGDD